MRKAAVLCSSLLVLSLTLACSSSSGGSDGPSTSGSAAGAAPTARPELGPNADKGKYVATIGLCVSCHTPRDASGKLDTTKLLAGGPKFEVAGFGTVYASNITPDKETGIGNWSSVEAKQAMLGIRPDKDRVAPPMPFAQYAKLSGEDLDNIVAYIQSVPAVKNAVAKPNLKVERKDLPRPPRRSGPQDTPNDAAVRGRYLVEAVLACGSCHTPKRETGEEDPSKSLAGSVSPYAPNVTSDKETGIGSWTKADIAKLLKEGVNKAGKPLPPGAHPVEAYAALTEDDLQQSAEYVTTIPAVVNQIPKP